MNQPHKVSHHIAHNQPYNNRTHTEELILHTVEQENNHQHQGSQTQIWEATKAPILQRRSPTSTRDDSHLDQTQTNHRHHNTRHQRRNHLLGIFKQPTHNNLYRSSRNTNPKDSRERSHTQAQRSKNRGDGTYKRKTSTLHTEQATAHRPNPFTLHKGRYARGQQRHRHQKAGRLMPQAQGLTDD